MVTEFQTGQQAQPPIREVAGIEPAGSVLRLGAAVSVVQSALFVVIGAAGLMLGADRLVNDGFASLAAANLTVFRLLCSAFVLIAVLSDQKWLIVVGLGAVTFLTGPAWHLWIPRLFMREVRERHHA
ncbi:MAG: hypothetical protein ACM32E_22930 [Gemmatimonadota bacterium]